MNISRVVKAWKEGFSLPEKLTISEWADKHRQIAPGLSPYSGKWETSRMPFTREIMDAMTMSHPCTQVTVMAASQTSGKTECEINAVGYYIAHDPRSILFVQPSAKQVKRFVSRFDKTVAVTPKLSEKISTRSRDRSNSMEMKDFDGGTLFFGSSESSADLASVTTPIVIGDELDRWARNVDGEGSSYDLAANRMIAYGRRSKFIGVSTPTIKSLSLIATLYDQSDQSQLWVPCPHCGEYQLLTWQGIRYEKTNIAATYYACQHNGCVIKESDKRVMIPKCEWRARIPERSKEHRGFQFSALYSPFGFGKTWANLASEWLKIHGQQGIANRHRLKVFVNTRLAETWHDATEQFEWQDIKARAVAAVERTIPEGYGLLTAGVDVQKDRWEIVVIAWRGEQIYVADYQVLYADTSDITQWALLDDWLRRPYESAHGASFAPECVLIDSGYLQGTVIQFTRARMADRWYASKGSNQRNKQLIGRPSKVEVTISGKADPFGGEQYPIGVDTGKDLIFANIAADSGRDPSKRKFTFSATLPDAFYEHLTAEVFDPHKGRYEKIPGRRNEGLDTLLLAIAAGYHQNVRVDKFSTADWELREKMLGKKFERETSVVNLREASIQDAEEFGARLAAMFQ